MSENMISIAISLAILLMMLVFVPCMEVTARGCKRINRTLRQGGDHEDDSARSSLIADLESSVRATNDKNSRSSNAT